jgi:hypothetical protein
MTAWLNRVVVNNSSIPIVLVLLKLSLLEYSDSVGPHQEGEPLYLAHSSLPRLGKKTRYSTRSTNTALYVSISGTFMDLETHP